MSGFVMKALLLSVFLTALSVGCSAQKHTTAADSFCKTEAGSYVETWKKNIDSVQIDCKNGKRIIVKLKQWKAKGL